MTTTGRDIYGRVKSVGGTPIVTTFEMVNAIPISPCQSFYFVSKGETETHGVPLIATREITSIHGYQLARLDRFSVAIAYARGACAVLTVTGFMFSLASLIMYFSGNDIDEHGMFLTRCGTTILGVGIIGGLLTYIPFTQRRERKIRTYCGQLLGICADPARLLPGDAVEFEEYAAVAAALDSRLEAILELIKVRVRIAERVTPTVMEKRSMICSAAWTSGPNRPICLPSVPVVQV